MLGLSTRCPTEMEDVVPALKCPMLAEYGRTATFDPRQFYHSKLKKSRLIRTSLFYSDWHGIRLYRMAIK